MKREWTIALGAVLSISGGFFGMSYFSSSRVEPKTDVKVDDPVVYRGEDGKGNPIVLYEYEDMHKLGIKEDGFVKTYFNYRDQGSLTSLIDFSSSSNDDEDDVDAIVKKDAETREVLTTYRRSQIEEEGVRERLDEGTKRYNHLRGLLWKENLNGEK